jgi:hypothetical protein
MKGKARLTALEINIPILTKIICKTANMPKTSKSTLDREETFNQFLVRQKYNTTERNKEMKNIPSKTAKVEYLLSPVALKKASNLAISA